MSDPLYNATKIIDALRQQLAEKEKAAEILLDKVAEKQCEIELVKMGARVNENKLSGDLASLQQQNAELAASREALRKLVKRIDEVHDDPHYQAVWFCYANHGGDYTNGPKYVDEMSAAKQLLSSPPSDALRERDRKMLEPVVETVRRASVLAQIASDWNLGDDGKVEIDDKWVSCYELKREFNKALAALREILGRDEIQKS